MAILDLPLELLEEIRGYLASQRDICALARTNRCFHTFLDPYLYQLNVRESGGTALLWGAEHGEMIPVQKILDIEPDIFVSRNEFRQMALELAVGGGYEKIVATLLAHGALQVDDYVGREFNPLMLAARHGRDPIVRMFLERGDFDPACGDRRFTPLGLAATNGHYAVVKLLLEDGRVNSGAKSGSMTSLLLARRGGYESIVQQMLSNGHIDLNDPEGTGITALRYAQLRGETEMFKRFLADESIDPNRPDDNGLTPLAGAASAGNVEEAKLLLADRRVDPNLELCIYGRTALFFAETEEIVALFLDSGRVDPDSTDRVGITPLIYAAFRGDEPAVRLLLASPQVDPDPKPPAPLEGDADPTPPSPLWYALRGSHNEVVKLLLDTGRVDPESQNRQGITPLFYATLKGNETAVRMLLATGRVDPDVKDASGLTPLSHAVKKGRTGIVKALLETGKVDLYAADWHGRMSSRPPRDTCCHRRYLL